MAVTIDELKDRFTYVGGGYIYLDTNKGTDSYRTFIEEMLRYTQDLSGDSERCSEVIDALVLGETGRDFSPVPESLKIMLRADLDYISSAGDQSLNDEYGCVALTLLYEKIAEYCDAGSDIPAAMRAFISDEAARIHIVYKNEM